MQVEREQILPKRTADSLRNFWKTVEREGLENYMRQALETNTWYCHAFCKIPKVKCLNLGEDDTGALEEELIRRAEKTIHTTITTHRQMVLKGQKIPGYGSAALSKTKKGGPNV